MVFRSYNSFGMTVACVDYVMMMLYNIKDEAPIYNKQCLSLLYFCEDTINSRTRVQ